MLVCHSCTLSLTLNERWIIIRSTWKITWCYRQVRESDKVIVTNIVDKILKLRWIDIKGNVEQVQKIIINDVIIISTGKEFKKHELIKYLRTRIRTAPVSYRITSQNNVWYKITLSGKLWFSTTYINGSYIFLTVDIACNVKKYFPYFF